MESSRFVTATPKTLSTRRVSSLGMASLLDVGASERRAPRHPGLTVIATHSLVHGDRRRFLPPRLALGSEVLGVHPVQAVMEVHLVLAAAVALADPALGVRQERIHLGRGQARQPFEAD